MYYDEQKISFAFDETEWASFEDERTADEKVKYVYDMKIGGVYTDFDDYNDFTSKFCGPVQGQFPLSFLLKQSLEKYYKKN